MIQFLFCRIFVSEEVAILVERREKRAKRLKSMCMLSCCTDFLFCKLYMDWGFTRILYCPWDFSAINGVVAILSSPGTALLGIKSRSLRWQVSCLSSRKPKKNKRYRYSCLGNSLTGITNHWNKACRLQLTKTHCSLLSSTLPILSHRIFSLAPADDILPPTRL